VTSQKLGDRRSVSRRREGPQTYVHAVPDAEIAIKQAGTGLTRQAKTNDTGQYLFPTVPGGSYEVIVKKQGFTTFTVREVQVPVNASTRLDAELQVGTVAESVSIEAAPPSLQTDRAEVRAEISAKQFELLTRIGVRGMRQSSRETMARSCRIPRS
jgi:hypothetical protein